MSAFFSLLIGLLFIVIPVLVLVVVVRLIYINQKRSREKKAIPQNWRVATGRVTEVSVEEAVRTRVEDDPFYYPNVQFEYVVEGRAYNGSQAVGRPCNNTSMAKQTLKYYPVGSEIPVYYNPERPEESRLQVK